MAYPNIWRCTCCGAQVEDSKCLSCSWRPDDAFYHCTEHDVKVPCNCKLIAPELDIPETGFYDADWKEITQWQVMWKKKF